MDVFKDISVQLNENIEISWQKTLITGISTQNPWPAYRLHKLEADQKLSWKICVRVRVSLCVRVYDRVKLITCHIPRPHAQKPLRWPQTCCNAGSLSTWPTIGPGRAVPAGILFSARTCARLMALNNLAETKIAKALICQENEPGHLRNWTELKSRLAELKDRNDTRWWASGVCGATITHHKSFSYPFKWQKFVGAWRAASLDSNAKSKLSLSRESAAIAICRCLCHQRRRALSTMQGFV